MNTLTGANEEIKFWTNFVKSPRFLDGWVSDKKTPELRQEVADFLNDFHIENHRYPKTLDVGSGVVSILNGSLPSYYLTACDPLGKDYEQIFDYRKHKIKPPVPFAAEELLFVDEYDIVHISNAIDHSYSPVIAYQKLLRAVKPEGFLIVQGFFNEGSYEAWKGMHQWNIYVENECLMLKNRHGDTWTIDSNPYRVSIYDVKELNKKWYVWIKQK